jgi:hypothetical protein
MSIYSDLKYAQDEEERRYLEDLLKWEARQDADNDEDDYDDSEEDE